MSDITRHLISTNTSLREAVARLDALATDLNLFVVDEQRKLIGSITDGDIRRGIVQGLQLYDSIEKVMHVPCSYLEQEDIDLTFIKRERSRGIRTLPIVDAERHVTDILLFRRQKTLLPLDAVIMAGGKGSRLLPLTQHIPKPLLPVGDKPIIEYNLRRLQEYGVRHITLTVNYLKEQLQDYASRISSEKQPVRCVEETSPLGTVGALSLITDWHHDYILLTNSDLLTNIDYEDFFLSFVASGADMMVAAVPYPVKIPYAILEVTDDEVTAFREKPEYTHYANTGIYLLKRDLLSLIPTNSFYNATDLMDRLLQDGRKLAYYPMVAYWLDVGKPDDYKKAQEDILHLDF